MALVDQTGRVHDISIVGLVAAIFGILAAAALCAKMAVDLLFAVFW